MNANSKLRWSFSTDNIVIDCDICIDIIVPNMIKLIVLII